MRWQHRTIRAEVFRRLKAEVLEIRLVKTASDCSAWSDRRGRKILVVIDTLHEGLLLMVIHELLHWILDPIYEAKVGKIVSEQWIVATAEKIRRDVINSGHEEKWRKAIERKTKGRKA